MCIVYGYIRFSPNTSQEEAERQIKELQKICEKKYSIVATSNLISTTRIEIFYDFHPGNTFDRPRWKNLKDKLQKGDRVVVTSLESFSKATFRITLNEIDNLQNRGIEFNVLNLKEDSKTFWEYVLQIYDYFEKIRLERQGAAIAAIGANAVLKKEKYPGRKTVLDKEFLQELQDLLKQNVTSPTELSRKLGRSRSTIYKGLKLLKEQGKFS
jgi:DNA invertase Pin-like site-specific DNA recombinase